MKIWIKIYRPDFDLKVRLSGCSEWRSGWVIWFVSIVAGPVRCQELTKLTTNFTRSFRGINIKLHYHNIPSNSSTPHNISGSRAYTHLGDGDQWVIFVHNIKYERCDSNESASDVTLWTLLKVSVAICWSIPHFDGRVYFTLVVRLVTSPWRN